MVEHQRLKMLNQLIGLKSDPDAIDQVLERLEGLSLTGTVYVGYPIVQLPEGPAAIDVLLVCREHGIVVINVERGAAQRPVDTVRVREQALDQALGRALERSGRAAISGKLFVDVRVLTFDAHSGAGLLQEPPKPTTPEAPSEAAAWGPRYGQRQLPSTPPLRPQPAPLPSGPTITGPNTLQRRLQELPPMDAASLRFATGAVQRVASTQTLSGTARIGALSGVRAEILATIGARISQLDQWQVAAAVEMPLGPQRIRGLAGTGKSVVLAYKAAYLHFHEPKSRVVLTFYSRALYGYLRGLVERFYSDLTGAGDPDWNRLHIRHAWGGQSRPGVYSAICAHLGVSAIGLETAKTKFGRTGIFDSVCAVDMQEHGVPDREPLYDAVLIDEAQDLPASFVELVYRVTSEPKRVIWAYDDLQNLSEYEPTPPATLFGRDRAGAPRVPELIHEEGEGRPDIILPVCYRNPPWVLTTAHALGLGIYRTPPRGSGDCGLVQYYDDPELWGEIGYELLQGSFYPGSEIVLGRSSVHTPPFFDELLDPADVVICRAFLDREAEAAWVANSIAKNVGEEGLQPRDILVVSADRWGKAATFTPVVQALYRLGITAHIAGDGGSIDELFGPADSVPVSNIRRAKGLEAAMVYVIHAEQSVPASAIVQRRNILFSAITRSRAWVRISGSGALMEAIAAEVAEVVESDYQLSFRVPSGEQLARIRKLQRDVRQSVRRVRKRGGNKSKAR